MLKRKNDLPGSVAKKLKCPEDLDRIVPDTVTAEGDAIPHSNEIQLDQIPKYGDPVDRCTLKKAGKIK